jgi:hypothetical protein
MTVINNIEIDNIKYNPNIIKDAIVNNLPIEDKLNVIIVISNPCQYATRYKLAREFINRIIMEEIHVNLYIVELAYNNQKYYVTQENNPKHLQLRGDIPLWHKENMINIGIKKLLPENWKAVAWIDADIEFESPTWALDTLKILNGTKDIVQIFSHCVDMDQNKNTLNNFSSFGYKFTKNSKHITTGLDYWHPGFAWACTRRAYDKMDGLYDVGILGSGDNIMALSLIQKVLCALDKQSTDNYKKTCFDFQERVKTLRLGYVPGVIRHYFHGTKKNRKYRERWQILVNYDYDPLKHITTDNNGLIIPSDNCPKELLSEIFEYFKERNEDEFTN